MTVPFGEHGRRQWPALLVPSLLLADRSFGSELANNFAGAYVLDVGGAGPGQRGPRPRPAPSEVTLAPSISKGVDSDPSAPVLAGF